MIDSTDRKAYTRLLIPLRFDHSLIYLLTSIQPFAASKQVSDKTCKLYEREDQMGRYMAQCV